MSGQLSQRQLKARSTNIKVSQLVKASQRSNCRSTAVNQGQNQTGNNLNKCENLVYIVIDF
ncbi:hypothetical protein Hanom_Chr08g00730871 [Helianthus anomalus]